MLYVVLIVGIGLAVYAAGQSELPGPRRRSGRRAHIEGDRLVMAEQDGRILHYFDLDALDYMALRTGRDTYVLELGFEGEHVRLEEQTPGVASVLDTLIRRPPEDADFALFGEAMEARGDEIFVFLDRRGP